MKDPAFLFYPNDWIGGTMGMTFEEKGAYIELLMMQFNRGHMTEHMIGQTVGQLWINIKDKFQIDNEGKYFNKRLEEEQNKRKAFTESRRQNIKGVNQHTQKLDKKEGQKTDHMKGHMENENIILFYNIEKEKCLSNGSDKGYLNLIAYLFGENELKQPIKHILSIPKQLEYSEYCDLKIKAAEYDKTVKDYLNIIVNTPKYAKGKKSLYLCLNQYIKNEERYRK